MSTVSDIKLLDLAQISLRQVNLSLRATAPNECAEVVIANPRGQHNIACGLQTPLRVRVCGHVGYYCAGMNQEANVTVEGHAGTGIAENMMSGRVHVAGNVSQCAAASAHGGLLVVDGNASARCGISLKGGDIVVKGNVGAMSGFLAQSGRMVVCGDAGESLGDSLYEARIYVKGTVKSLGTDCIEKPMTEEHLRELAALLASAGCDDDLDNFRRYGSARKLYHFHIDHASDY